MESPRCSLLRVDWESKDEESTKAILKCLNVMAKFQLDKPIPGVMVYHFTRPDPINRPYFLQFTEVYKDEIVFWAHTDDQGIGEAFTEAFIPPDKNKLKSTMFSYGPMLSIDEKVKNACDYLKSLYPGTAAGYCFNNSPTFGSGDPVMMFCEISAKDSESTADITAKLAELGKLNSNKAITFHVSIPEAKDFPTKIEMIAVYSTNQLLMSHFGDDNAKECVASINKLCDKFCCQAYGKVSDKAQQVLKGQNIVVTVGQTDVGYVLHPKAQEA